MDSQKCIRIGIVGDLCSLSIADIHVIGLPDHDHRISSALQFITKLQTDLKIQFILCQSATDTTGSRRNLRLGLRGSRSYGLLLRVGMGLMPRVNHNNLGTIRRLGLLQLLIRILIHKKLGEDETILTFIAGLGPVSLRTEGIHTGICGNLCDHNSLHRSSCAEIQFTGSVHRNCISGEFQRIRLCLSLRTALVFLMFFRIRFRLTFLHLIHFGPALSLRRLQIHFVSGTGTKHVAQKNHKANTNTYFFNSYLLFHFHNTPINNQ